MSALPESEGQRLSAGKLSPLVRALRYRTDEVQLGRALTAVAHDAAVAKPLLTSMLTRAVGGRASSRQRLLPVPDDVRCIDEHILHARQGRTATRRRSKDAGRVDLDFSGGDGWRVMVELKINSAFGDRQLERYIETRTPVMALLRNPASAKPRLRSRYWLGAAAWEHILDDLYELPVPSHDRDVWRGLLDVLRAEGDTDLFPPVGVPEVVDAAAQLNQAADQIFRAFTDLLAANHSRFAADSLTKLRRTAVRGKPDGPWVGFGIGTWGDTWLWLAVRNFWSRAPRMRLLYYPPPNRRSRLQIQPRLARLRRLHYEEVGDWYLLERAEPRLEARSPDTIACVYIEQLEQLVAHKVFETDLEWLSG